MVIGEVLECLEILGVALVISIHHNAGNSFITAVLAVSRYQFYVPTVLLRQTCLKLIEAILSGTD